MKPLLLHHPSSSIILSFLSFILLMISIIDIPTCMCDDNEQYTNCNTTFNCGKDNPNLKYPFWGVNRKEYCGVSSDPNMNLTCEESKLKITINSVKYRILEWNDTIQRLKVARDDYWSGICAVSVSGKHSNSTFDNTMFQRDVDVSSKLSLLYNCDTTQPGTVFSTTCSNTKIAYTALDSTTVLSCDPSVIVEIPILGIQVVNDITEALQGGFDLKWTGDYGKCQRCIDSGGVCGNDGETEFKCFCEDAPYATICGSQKTPTPSSSMSSALFIQLINS
jgi:hypothetical protein